MGWGGNLLLEELGFFFSAMYYQEPTTNCTDLRDLQRLIHKID